MLKGHSYGDSGLIQTSGRTILHQGLPTLMIIAKYMVYEVLPRQIHYILKISLDVAIRQMALV